MKKLRLLTTISALALFMSACSLYHIDSENVTFDYHPQKSSKNDVAYLEKVDQPYDVIGRAIVNAQRNQKMEDVIDKLKYEAAILGGNAITNITTNAGTGKWAKAKPKFLQNANIRVNFVADVIILK